SYRRELFRLKETLDKHLHYLEEEFPRYHNLKYNQDILQLDTVQKMLRKQDLTLIEYFCGKELSWAFVVDANNVNIVPLPFDSSLTAEISSFRESIMQQSDHLYTKLGFELYKNLIQPVLPHIKGANLFLVPDGFLNLLPFEALLTRPVNSNDITFSELPYLIKYFNISYS